jgi:hypothetical protein
VDGCDLPLTSCLCALPWMYDFNRLCMSICNIYMDRTYVFVMYIRSISCPVFLFFNPSSQTHFFRATSLMLYIADVFSVAASLMFNITDASNKIRVCDVEHQTRVSASLMWSY